MSVARNLLVTEKIDVDDYNAMKNDYRTIIQKLERQLGEVSDDRGNIEQLMNQGLDNLLRLGETYEKSTLAEARDLIGLIYPENFTFRENDFQTARTNEIVNCIYLVNSKLEAKKNGTKDDFIALSRVVTSTGFKPVTS